MLGERANTANTAKQLQLAVDAYRREHAQKPKLIKVTPDAYWQMAGGFNNLSQTISGKWVSPANDTYLGIPLEFDKDQEEPIILL